MTENRFENLLGKLNQLPEGKRQRPRDYLDQNSFWQEREQRMKTIFGKYHSKQQNHERYLPSESETIKLLRQKLEAMISARYERYYSPAQVRHSRASNWDVPSVESAFWDDLAQSLEKQSSNIIGVKVLGLTLTRHPKVLPKFDLELDCSIDCKLHLFSWAYNPNKRYLAYGFGREDRLNNGVHVEPSVEELKKRFLV